MPPQAEARKRRRARLHATAKEDGMAPLAGLLPAIVIDNVDPENLGRIQVRIAGDGGEVSDRWARLVAPMAGSDRGIWFLPEVGDEVLVALDDGAARDPYVLGGLWSATSPPPDTANAANDRKLIRSRSGVQITFDDRAGQERLVIDTPGGQVITLHGGSGSIEIVDGNGGSVRLASDGIQVNATGKVTIRASRIEIDAGELRVNAGMSLFSGVVRCDTLISNSVVSTSYTPGAGNIW
jgi:uncharacterized protein involved in type VI secretion and phage assembly